MSIYECYFCEELKDSDYYPCSEAPGKPLKLACDDCISEYEQARLDDHNDAMQEERKLVQTKMKEFDDDCYGFLSLRLNQT